MAGIVDVDVVDIVAEDGNGRVVLALIEDRPWDDDSEQQEREVWLKLDNYTGYVKSGQLYDEYPEFKGKPVVFTLYCAVEPTEKFMGILSAVSNAVEPQGITVEYEVNPEVAE